MSVGVLALLPSLSLAQSNASISGQVLDGQTGKAIAGVRVTLRLGTGSDSVLTSADGRFAFDPSTKFSELDRATDVVELSFVKDGYEQLDKSLRTAKKGEISVSFRAFRLSKLPSEETVVDSTVENTVLLVPYEIDPKEEADRLNRRLPLRLKRQIETHLQALDLQTPPEVGIEPLATGVPGPGGDEACRDVAPTDTFRLRDCGSKRKALAVVAGYGEVSTAAAGQQEVTLASEYVIIPSLGRFRPRTFSIQESVPLGQLSLLQLSGEQHGLWGRNTLLALALAEARAGLAETPKNLDRLKQARTWLQAEKAQAGPGNEKLVREIEEVEQILRELEQ